MRRRAFVGSPATVGAQLSGELAQALGAGESLCVRRGEPIPEALAQPSRPHQATSSRARMPSTPARNKRLP